jgi:hypothetical protein
MKKLFIIGNGFDLDHDLRTEYSSFRKFLCSYPCEEDARYAKFLLCQLTHICADDWSDLENSLCKLNEVIAEKINSLKNDEEVEGYCQKILEAYNKLKGVFFRRWLENIKQDDCLQNASFRKMIENDSCFITFNYTRTLETVYGIAENNILHIHGVCDGKPPCGLEAKFTDSHFIFGYPASCEDSHTDFGIPRHKNATPILVMSDLKKDCAGVICKHQDFFKRITGIQEVFSYGFSYGCADLPYITEIFNHICSDYDDSFLLKWYFHNYCNDNIVVFKKKVEDAYKKRDFDVQRKQYSANSCIKLCFGSFST